MIKINKNRFLYALMGLILLDLIVDGIDDFGTSLFFWKLIKTMIILAIALLASISITKRKQKKK